MTIFTSRVELSTSLEIYYIDSNSAKGWYASSTLVPDHKNIIGILFIYKDKPFPNEE